MNDKRIIEGFVSGEKNAYGEIEKWILEVIGRKLWVEEISPDEILSDVRLKLLLMFRDESFSLTSTLKAFVQTVTRNTLVDCIRSYKRTRQRLKPLSDNISVPATQEKEFLEGEGRALFEKIITLLAPHCRELWKLLFVDKLTYNQIALKNGTTEATMKMRAFRCKERAIELRKKLS